MLDSDHFRNHRDCDSAMVALGSEVGTMLHRISGERLSTVETIRCSVHDFIAIRGEVDH